MPGVLPLRRGDPAELGGHVLLGRLGAGGMGVVYLGRSTGGALAALKVVRAEYAADPGFLARFRREAEATRRLASRWLVPVTAADVDGPERWLATAFVPGLTLAEAVDGYGALPDHTVRILGACLAEALTDVHAAGLVHRDVKPGNVLLALDGPRLIDFGIVRPQGVTAITASGLVVGSPGFLSPEQAQARSGEVGPAGDVFSLGCVLAYAATGRRPFGTGSAAGVLYHTVHEEPDLEDVSPQFLPLLRACLDKTPGRRPPAAAVFEAFDAPAGLGAAPTDPRVHAMVTAAPAGGTEGWLPQPLPGIVAERAAEVLALPDPDPSGDGDTDPTGDPGSTGPALTSPRGSGPRLPSRRLVLGLGAATAVAAGGGLAAVGMAWSGDGKSGGRTPLARHTIGLQADLSGESRALGIAQERGARLAVAHFNAAAGRPFDLELSVRDDHGQASRAARTAKAFVEDRSVLAVIGPTGDAGLEDAASTFEEALMPQVTVSCADAGSQVSHVWYRTFFRLRADENALVKGFFAYLVDVEPSERTAIVDDRAATGDEDWALAERIRQFPPSGGSTTTHGVRAGSDDFDSVAESVRAAGAQAVVFVGASPHRAASCARALDRAGFDGARMVPEPVLRPELPEDGSPARLPFLEEAGGAAEGWACVATYTDATRVPAAEDFAASYREEFPEPPALGPTAPFALEAYDALLLIASTMEGAADGGPNRGSLTTRLRSSHRDGLAKPLSFDPERGAFVYGPGIFLYRVERGAAVLLGQYEEVAASAVERRQRRAGGG